MEVRQLELQRVTLSEALANEDYKLAGGGSFEAVGVIKRKEESSLSFGVGNSDEGEVGPTPTKRLTKKEEKKIESARRMKERGMEKQKQLEEKIRVREEKRLELERIREERRIELERQKEERRIEFERQKEERRIEAERRKLELERIREEKRVELERIRDEKRAEHERQKAERAAAREAKREADKKRKEEEIQRRIDEKFNKPDDTDFPFRDDYAPPEVDYPPPEVSKNYVDIAMLYEFFSGFAKQLFSQTMSISWEEFRNIFFRPNPGFFYYSTFFNCTKGVLTTLLNDGVNESLEGSFLSKAEVTSITFAEVTRLFLLECPSFVGKHPGLLSKMSGEDYCNLDVDERLCILKFLTDEVMASKTVSHAVDSAIEKLEGLEKKMQRLERDRENAIFEIQLAIENTVNSQAGEEDKPDANDLADGASGVSDVDSTCTSTKGVQEAAEQSMKAAVESIEKEFASNAAVIGLDVLKQLAVIRCLYLGQDRFFNEYVFLPSSCQIVVIKGEQKCFDELKENIIDEKPAEAVEEVVVDDEMDLGNTVSSPVASCSPVEGAQEAVCMEVDSGCGSKATPNGRSKCCEATSRCLPGSKFYGGQDSIYFNRMPAAKLDIFFEYRWNA